jgi:uncharacterized protein
MTSIVETKKIDFRNPTALEGFPGVGLVGHITVTYLVNALGLEEIGYITSDKIPPISLVLEGKVMPPLRIYGRPDMMLFICDIAIPDFAIWEISGVIGEYLLSKGVRQSISLAGIGVGQKSEKVWGAGTSEKILEEYHLEALPVGSITGMSGSLIAECIKLGIPSIGLLAETMGDVPDPRASANLVTTLNAVLSLKVDVEPLLREAELIEARYSELVDDMKKIEHKEVSSMYG